MEPFLSHKTGTQSEITLLDKNVPAPEDKEITETLKNFFAKS